MWDVDAAVRIGEPCKRGPLSMLPVEGSLLQACNLIYVLQTLDQLLDIGIPVVVQYSPQYSA